jgi:hypothetical protein
VTELATHIYEGIRDALDAIPSDERPDIYVVSLLVYDEEDDPRKATVTVGYNGESDVAHALALTDEQEARWNYAFWRQNELAVLCGSESDPAGAHVRDVWVRARGLWFDAAADEVPMFDPRGELLTQAFISVMEAVVRRLHDGDIERIFGTPLPVLIHELEYYDAIAEQNERANPSGVVPAAFVEWCRGE